MWRLMSSSLAEYDEYDETRTDFSRWKGIYETWRRRKQSYTEQLKVSVFSEMLQFQPTYQAMRIAIAAKLGQQKNGIPENKNFDTLKTAIRRGLSLNILIDTIRIAGFRGIKNLEMSLPRVTLLIGMNNSGKTSVLKALQLALGDYSRYLSEEDFYIGSDDKRSAEIVVDVRIVPVDEQGDRIDTFDDDWQAEFGGGKIQSEANSRQYVALRTRGKPDEIKGGFDTSYSDNGQIIIIG